MQRLRFKILLARTDLLRPNSQATFFHIAILVVTLTLVTPSLSAPNPAMMKEPADPLVATAKSSIGLASDSLPSNPFSLYVKQLFYIYRNILGPTKGQRCPMSPSCSTFGKAAIKQHGFIRGLLLTCDRLHRCGHDLQYYRYQLTNEGVFYEDDPK